MAKKLDYCVYEYTKGQSRLLATFLTLQDAKAFANLKTKGYRKIGEEYETDGSNSAWFCMAVEIECPDYNEYDIFRNKTLYETDMFYVNPAPKHPVI